MKTKTKKITKDMKISEILNTKPKAAKTLFETGIMCFGCGMADQETLEQGLKAHGFNKKQIDVIVDKINSNKKN